MLDKNKFKCDKCGCDNFDNETKLAKARNQRNAKYNLRRRSDTCIESVGMPMVNLDLKIPWA